LAETRNERSCVKKRDTRKKVTVPPSCKKEKKDTITPDSKKKKAL